MTVLHFWHGEFTDTGERSQLARAAVTASWAKTADRAARTEPARRAALSRFDRQVDPHAELEPRERERRARLARLSYFRYLALRSARARGCRRHWTPQGGLGE
jgi:hypothetical protein